jgi:hypothetical protein
MGKSICLFYTSVWYSSFNWVNYIDFNSYDLISPNEVLIQCIWDIFSNLVKYTLNRLILFGE